MKRVICQVSMKSVQLRARGLDNSEARQHVLMELYEKFFRHCDEERCGAFRNRLHTSRGR